MKYKPTLSCCPSPGFVCTTFKSNCFGCLASLHFLTSLNLVATISDALFLSPIPDIMMKLDAFSENKRFH